MTGKEKGKDSVLADKEKFGKSGADEKVAHMGDKAGAAKSGSGSAQATQTDKDKNKK